MLAFSVTFSSLHSHLIDVRNFTCRICNSISFSPSMGEENSIIPLLKML